MNNKEDDFKQSTIAIVGLGLMGGSLALALNGKCKRLIGIDRDKETLDLAMKRGAIDAADTDPGVILPQADIIILALPVSVILEIIHQIPEYHPGPAVVMDLGSTKVKILNSMSELPMSFDPIGGHPMCGKETSGFKNADPGIYRSASFALTPLERTSQRARSFAVSLTHAVGAVPIWLDPETHDKWVAFTSHLPYLLAVTLARSTPQEAAPLVGPGFRDVSRLAGSDTRMMIDILTTNGRHVLETLKRFQENLKEAEMAIQGGERSNLESLLESASGQRDFLMGNWGNDEA